MVSTSPQAVLGLETMPEIDNPYLDSSVFIAHIKQETLPASGGLTRVQITRALLNGAAQGRFRIRTSFWTLAEVRRVRSAQEQLTADELPTVNSLFAEYFEHRWIEPVELGREIAEKAQTLGAIYGILPGDAVHLASAILSGSKLLMAWDKPFLAAFPTGECEGVRILEPFWEGAIPT
jgi:predicted nucleic acid-binding protein